MRTSRRRAFMAMALLASWFGSVEAGEITVIDRPIVETQQSQCSPIQGLVTFQSPVPNSPQYSWEGIWIPEDEPHRFFRRLRYLTPATLAGVHCAA